METSQLKKHIAMLVEESENNRILEMVYTILEQDFQLEQQRKKPIWDSLNETEKAAVTEGIQQLDRGEGIPHASVVQKAEALLKR
ncbi:MAG: hypothetical protein MUD08_01915 [Cytophagales bacterium]|jgi:hypothetical protein|nr:hypothetical protein [Cytophagales bacterium]